MSNVDLARLGPLFYTGTSPFLVANAHFMTTLVAASSQCAIHASEDIVDANGLKLWASGRPIDERLLERMSSRKLRKPIELCVYAADPVASAAIARTIEEQVAASPDLRAALGTHLDAVLKSVAAIVPSPTELMLLSVLRHGTHDRMAHAALVTALALTVARVVDLHPELTRPLARAALLHDVGLLYLPAPLLEAAMTPGASQVREIRNHPLLGAQVAIELARCGKTVAHLIASSHERLDGWGYPRGLTVADLSLPEQALLFAEAMAPLLESGANPLRRAAVTARLIPGEFAPDMVNWIGAHAQDRPAQNTPGSVAASVGLDLKQLHSVLAHVQVMLHAPDKESSAVRAAAATWRSAVESLVWVLRATGVEEALSCGMNIEPQNEVETIELSVLGQELLERIRTLRLRVEQAQTDLPELESSPLVLRLLDALQACEPAPQGASGDAQNGGKILPWTRLLRLGVREIDDQHRVLVELLNRLGAAQRDGAPPGVQGEVLTRLIEYVGVHFATEARLMAEHQYAGAAAHLAEHAELSARVTQLVTRQNEGAAPALEELTTFLRQWLTYHILQTDRELALALNARGVH